MLSVPFSIEYVEFILSPSIVHSRVEKLGEIAIALLYQLFNCDALTVTHLLR